MKIPKMVLAICIAALVACTSDDPKTLVNDYAAAVSQRNDLSWQMASFEKILAFAHHCGENAKTASRPAFCGQPAEFPPVAEDVLVRTKRDLEKACTSYRDAGRRVSTLAEHLLWLKARTEQKRWDAIRDIIRVKLDSQSPADPAPHPWSGLPMILDEAERPPMPVVCREAESASRASTTAQLAVTARD